MSGGIIYDYEDGGSYCGEWEGETSHGFGVCTGPRGEGTFEGRWNHGNQVSGVYRWPNGVQYSGTWEDNARHGMGVETRTDGTEYSGEFTRGTRGPFGVASLPNGVYQGQWANGAQDGEGVETYRDHGCYRGQYKKGLRSGLGTRTSAAYEARADNHDIPLSSSEPSLQAILSRPPSDSPRSSLKRVTALQQGKTDSVSSLKASHTSTSLQTSTKGFSLGQAGLKEELAQVYEGEWVSDKRQGHGVLKVFSKYTYYGQWNKNTITGYGVMVYENGSKQEGEWHNGTLIAVVKRPKVLLFKTHQLELKVKDARTKALQAAEAARHKAELAGSRASSAVNKSRAAAKVAERAKVHAQIAVEKAEAYKNAPRVSESLKSPISSTSELKFPGVDPDHTSSTLSMLSSASSNSSHLSVNTTVVPSSSFDDLLSLHSDSGLAQGSEGRGSDSPGSVRRSSDLISVDEGVSLRGLSQEERLRRILQQHSSSSEKSFDSTDSKKKSRRISDSVVGRGNVRRQRKMRSLSLSDHEEELEEDEDMRGQRSRHHRIDKRTGEVDQDVSDDESHDKLSSAGARLSQDKDAMTIDLLNQMARWNRLVAYLNFGLLLVLLLLIVLVFASMYYYRLLSYYENHPDPEDQPSPGGFLTPLA